MQFSRSIAFICQLNGGAVYMEGLSEHLEDYLETILILQNENTVARVKDIAEKHAVLSGTVTSALRSLAGKGLVNYKPYGYITLTKKGKNTLDAVVEAANTRLRPILMTALTTIMGLFPLAIAGGIMSPLAITVMGGLLVSTFLTLVVIPSVYIIADDFLIKRKKT